MLTLPIKEPYFSMIWSGEKKEEYREIKDHWTSRFSHIGLLTPEGIPTGKIKTVRFCNGYGKNRPSFCADVTLTKGEGRPEWGAKKSKTYYVLSIVTVLWLSKKMSQPAQAEKKAELRKPSIPQNVTDAARMETVRKAAECRYNDGVICGLYEKEPERCERCNWNPFKNMKKETPE